MELKDKRTFYENLSNKPFSGWDFRYLTETGRVDSEPLPWSYGSIVLSAISKSKSLLDMGTGGGELLSMLQPLPEDTHATEGYTPNIPIAKGRLNPIGVEVHEITDEKELPFENDSFDLIINKHESYSPEEVFRILKPEGQFITQQVGGTDSNQLNEMLKEDIDFGFGYWNMSYAREELNIAGFQIELEREAYPSGRFYDIGAVLYYLKAAPWQVPGFSIDTHIMSLMDIEAHIDQNGYLECKEHRFIIKATKRKI